MAADDPFKKMATELKVWIVATNLARVLLNLLWR
jgi:hypothetical protein